VYEVIIQLVMVEEQNMLVGDEAVGNFHIEEKVTYVE